MNKSTKRVAFVYWLVKIGYNAKRCVNGDTVFWTTGRGKGFPQGVAVLANGRLNKPAKALFKEFEGYLRA